MIPLVAKKYRVYSPDTLGIGFSPPAPGDWEFEQLCDSFIEFMDALGIEKASLVGQQTGSSNSRPFYSSWGVFSFWTFTEGAVDYP